MGPRLPRLMMAARREWYRPFQDLWAISKAAVTLHLVILNPYTLLSQVPPTATWFTCLDLKDNFSCILVVPSSQPIFPFKWKNLHIVVKTQLTWTKLPQGFKNSPTLFGEALAGDLKPLTKGGGEI
ncbi:hypothetical protein HJG60_010638 [Phyllostomus discolor]|uniref:Reverse transcriptase domain-containing protein n=1 Tax=Phyllostomus discolor TaxID=89673 RepID=A0A834ANK4_9CHIR|nr:hypothetical protein HJG60_010638 [Phyllostomus discolor]